MKAYLLLAIGLMLAAGCGDSDAEFDEDASTDTDTDTDSDSDGDSDSDSDGCSNPEVEQEGTSLFWLRCPVGQCLVDGQCQWPGDGDAGTAEAVTYEWEEAKTACPDPYRLPTIQEIAGLLGNCDDLVVDENTPCHCDPCPDSGDCDAIYPEIADNPEMAWENLHWSSTEMNVSNAWRANLKTGVLDPFSMTTSTTVICVREE